jgi:GNAT superfamily N-acetyltransferase
VALRRVHVAHADAWQAQGRLREPYGGGALEVRGLRLMASGLPQAQWNGGDVTAADADVETAREFYAARGAAWGLRVPPGIRWAHGRRLLTLRVMALDAAAFRPAPAVAGLAIGPAGAGELEAVLGVDAVAFGEEPDVERAWIEPHFGAPGVDVALARLDGEPAATGYTIRTDDRAGPCLYLAGIAVLPRARRRGVGAAVSSWLLERGLARGAELAHLHADTDAAARVYARLGFGDTEGLHVYVCV